MNEKQMQKLVAKLEAWSRQASEDTLNLTGKEFTYADAQSDAFESVLGLIKQLSAK
jgi:hypothetical protein